MEDHLINRAKDLLQNDAPYRLKHARCNSAYCWRCGLSKSFKTRNLIKRTVKTWSRPKLLTLTINRGNFANGYEAYQYIMKGRLISRLMRELNQLGYLNHQHYVWVMEFHLPDHDGMYWPHFHLVVDTDFIDQQVIQDIWNRFSPTSEDDAKHKAEVAELAGDDGVAKSWRYYRLGRVNIKAPDTHDNKGVKYTPEQQAAWCAQYVGKYLTWFPDEEKGEAFPQWVLDSSYIPRSHTSHGYKAFHGLADEDLQNELEEMSQEEIDKVLDFDREALEEELKASWPVFPYIEGYEDEDGELQPIIRPGWFVRICPRTGHQEVFRDASYMMTEAEEPPVRKTIAERVEGCGKNSIILREDVYERNDRLVTKWVFVKPLAEPYKHFEEYHGKQLTQQDIDKIIGESRDRINNAWWDIQEKKRQADSNDYKPPKPQEQKELFNNLDHVEMTRRYYD